MVKDVGGSEASITPADQTSGTYKAVLILGQGMAVEDSVLDRFRQEGYLLIGDGKKPVLPKDCEVLKNKIDSNTKICIYAQGSLDTVKGHSIEGAATAEFLRVIKKQSKNGQPLNINLISSFADKAATDVDLLPPGSMLVAHGTADTALSNDVGLKTLKDFTQDMSTPSAANPWQDCVDNFTTYVKQTTTIVIGEFRYTMSPPEGVLTDLEQIKAYLENERQIFVKRYNEEFDPPLTIGPEIDLTQATTWINAQRLSVASQTPSRNTDLPVVTAAPAPPELPKAATPAPPEPPKVTAPPPSEPPKVTAPPPPPPHPPTSKPSLPTIKPDNRPKSSEMSPPPVPNSAKIMQQFKKQKSEQILAIEPQTDLARTVRSVVSSYSTFAKSKMGSRHGETGRKRAESFYASIARETDENKVNEAIKTYLKDETNGNTHPHSFRTMLLSKLTHAQGALTPETLKNTSVNYNTMRENYSNRSPTATLTG